MKEKHTVTADELAEILFQLFVLNDEVKIREQDLGPYVIDTYSQNTIFQKHIYFYLVALIAVALTSEFERRENIAKSIRKFRQLANAEAQKRWNIFQYEADNIVEETADKLAKLLFTDRNKERAVSFEWGKDYLGQVMVDSTNPIVLWKISMFWMNRFLTLMKAIASLDLSNKK